MLMFTDISSSRDLVLSHMIRIEDEAFLSRYFSQSTHSTNNVSVSISQSSGMFASSVFYVPDIVTMSAESRHKEIQSSPGPDLSPRAPCRLCPCCTHKASINVQVSRAESRRITTSLDLYGL